MESERPDYVNAVTKAPMSDWDEVILYNVHRSILSHHKPQTDMMQKVPLNNIRVLGDFRPISPQVIKAYVAFLRISHQHEKDFDALPYDMSMDMTLYHLTGSSKDLGVAEGSHRVLTAKILGVKYIYCRVIKNKNRTKKEPALNKFERYTITKAANSMKQRTQSTQDVTAVLCQLVTAYLRHLNENGTPAEWKQTLETLLP